MKTHWFPFFQAGGFYNPGAFKEENSGHFLASAWFQAGEFHLDLLTMTAILSNRPGHWSEVLKVEPGFGTRWFCW